MFVEVCKNNGIDYLRLVNGIRVDGKNGNKTVRKKVILNIGPLSKFDDGKPNYVKRLKESFKNGNPLIDSLLPFVDNNSITETYSFSIQKGDPFCFGETKLYSHVLLEKLLDELGVISLFASYKGFTKIEFDLVGFFRLLTYGRILNPTSKINTTKQNNDYYDPIIKNNFYKYNVYDTLDFIYEHKKQIVSRINKHLIDLNERKNEIVYYDVTNFFFETENIDDDIKQYGVCKEERKLPIVQMGLFMDENGYPISIEIFPGNTLDHLTVKQALNNNIDDLINSKFIFIADRGICSFDNMLELVKKNKSYIVSKSIKKSNKEVKDWILNQDDYIDVNKSYKYKSKVFSHTYKDEAGTKQTLRYKSVVYWSEKFYKKEAGEYESFFEFLNNFKDNPSSFRFSKAMSKNIKQFLKDTVTNKETGEIIEAKNVEALIDFDKVEKFKEFFGYYQIITSELDMDDLEIIKKYGGLTQIENQFRVMKSSLETRPIYVRNKEHIEAHLIICLISLVIIRLIQRKIISKDLGNKTKKDGNPLKWEIGLSSDRIQKALNKWTVEKLPDDYFRFSNINDEDLSLILKAFDLEIEKKLYKRAELKQIKKSIKLSY